MSILLVSPKTAYATGRLLEEAGKLGVEIESFDVKELAEKNFEIDVSKYSALYVRQANPYFTEIISLARKFKDAGKYVVDGEMILDGYETSKWEMYKQFLRGGVPIPKTESLISNCLSLTTDGLKSSPISSMSFRANASEPRNRLAKGSLRSVGCTPSVGMTPDMGCEIVSSYPYVLKWVYGSAGNGTHLVHNEEEFNTVIKTHPKEEWLVQEYIKPDFEYQVITVGYKAFGKVLKFRIQNDEFKIDLHRYSIMATEQVPEVVTLAEQSSKIMKRELAKTDIIEANGKLYVLETNRSPSLLPFEPYAKVSLAGEFLKYILLNSSNS
jgi:glutathione synthase/RimK-type ligase-like ATP-grasp enzyme